MLSAELAGVLCGIVPARRVFSANFARVLRHNQIGSPKRRRGLRQALVVIEVALSMVLLIGATLLYATLSRLSQVDVGFDARNVLSGVVVLPAALPSGQDGSAFVAQVNRNAPFFKTLRERLLAVPGVVDAALIDAMPLSGTSNINGAVSVPGHSFETGNEVTVEFKWVTPEYFRTLGIPLLSGESFRPSDQITWPPTGSVLVNQALAQLIDPAGGAGVVGREILAMGGTFSIAGVVGNVKQWSRDRATSPEVYFNLLTTPSPSTATVLLRTRDNPLLLAEQMRRAVTAADPGVPLYSVRSIEQASDQSNSRRKFALSLFGVFGAIAGIVTAIGIHGVVAYTVAQRVSEIGLKLALGAKPRTVLVEVLRHSLGMVALGVVLGSLAALALTRFLEGLVWGIEGALPMAFLATAAGVGLLGIVAAVIPARRASLVEPTEAIRTW